MFRMGGMEASAEDKARIRKDVQKNICSFAILCAALRVAPFVIAQLKN